MALTPPQPAPKWDHSAEEITKLSKDTIEEYRKVLDQVGSLEEKNANFELVFLTLARTDAHFKEISEPMGFYQEVSTESEIRDASNAAESLFRDFGVEASMRLDVFNSKVAAEKNIKASGQWDKLLPEDRRLIEKMILDGSRAGLALPEEKRNDLTILQKELQQTCLEFNKNFSKENGFVSFTEEELKGVPKDVVSGYTKRTTDDGKEVYDVTYKTPDIFPLFKYAENPNTRKIAYEAFDSRLAINTPILDKILELRRKIAKLLGYNTWADYATEDKMAKSGGNVQEFLDDLASKLLPVARKELEIFLAIKKKEYEEMGLPYDGEYYNWDSKYYDRKFTEESLSLDQSLVKEYFPVSVIVPRILGIYQDLLGVKFEEIKGASTWHPEVQTFSVWEKDAKDESDFVGYCHLDLFPRAEKYPHAAVWSLLPGYEKPDGSRNYPVAAMVANVAKPTPEKPALMRHEDVVVFFHEMGHVFHTLLSKTKFARFHGTNGPNDFVEAPSQMLENWCWEPKVLEKMSSHYETQKPLTPELIEKVVKSRYVNVGLFYLRQVFFAKFDLQVHTDQEDQNYSRLYNKLREEVALVKYDKECPGQAAFGHIVEGYDVSYYGYTYSLVFAADMYATVFQQDPLDPVAGKRYRDKVLLVGASRDELDFLEDFIGRKPNNKAFLKALFGNLPDSKV